MTDDTTFSICSGFFPLQPPLYFRVSPSTPNPHTPPPSPCLRGVLPVLLFCPPPPSLPYFTSLSSLHQLHLSQTDPTFSQEGKACGAENRDCIPTLSSHIATHALIYLGYTWIHTLYMESSDNMHSLLM